MDRELKVVNRMVGARIRVWGLNFSMWCTMAVISCGIQATESPVSISEFTVPYATPPGITLVEVSERIVHKRQVLWLRLGDRQGETLFVSDSDEPGVSHCTGDCEQEFPPVIALPGSSEMGEWSLIKRPDGRQQWAFRDKPLYRFARETRLNEVVDNLLAQRKSSSPSDYRDSAIADGLLFPPEGWHVARYEPTEMPVPSRVRVGDLPTANGFGFVTTAGKTLYYSVVESPPVNQRCEADKPCWQPLLAAELANPVGEFTPVWHADGTRQWAYKGKLLFSWGGDFMAGDINGIKQPTNSDWRVAMIVQHFMPVDAMVRYDPVHGPILSSADGLPLYTRYTVERRVYIDRTVDDMPYAVGKQYGIKGCDAECLQIWRPLLAPKNARPSGFWEVVDRGDGTKQWAYKGFVQFTHASDKPFTYVTGNNKYVYVVGDDGRYKIKDVLPEIHTAAVNAIFRWGVSDIHPRIELFR